MQQRQTKDSGLNLPLLCGLGGEPQALCCCVWLVPLRLYTDLVNTACLVRAVRNLGGNLLISIFLSRELVCRLTITIPFDLLRKLLAVCDRC